MKKVWVMIKMMSGTQRDYVLSIGEEVAEREIKRKQKCFRRRLLK